ncbi:MAG: hypothetical protein V7735_23270 [Photobacterium frigidiphilum]|uniref:hypothetical protein n=1 Tax=Photobacterium frigidiphilum TaxID=264736 RepID=UPI003001CF21
MKMHDEFQSLGENVEALIAEQKKVMFVDNDAYESLNHDIETLSARRDEIISATSHGGSRKGAGRKKGEPTTLIRVCEDIEPLLKQISDGYKCAQDKTAYKHTLVEFIDSNVTI